MRPSLAPICVLLLAAAAHAQPRDADGDPAPLQGRGDPLVRPETLTDREVQWAIDALSDGLYARRNQHGNWEFTIAGPAASHINMHVSGQTTLVVLALLSSGQSYQNPRLAPAIDFLRAQKADYTYVRALRAHVWALLPDRFARILELDRDWLLRSYGFESGSWAYTNIPMESGYDNSLTQYGVLGLWEAAKRGHEVPPRFWQRVEQHFLRTQHGDGGWNYRPQWPNARGSMTAAGLTCLFITQDFLHADAFVRPGVSGTPQQKAIELGLGWLDGHFTASRHPGMSDAGAETYLFYYLYGIERVGLASGYKRFGRHDWFREGAAEIINRLCDPVLDPQTGELVGFTARAQPRVTGASEPPIVQMSFGLMFLSHGRIPIAVSKLRDDRFAWNNRPRDAARLADFLSEEMEDRVAWQILEVAAPLEEWFDGPLVYLASHEASGYVERHRAELERRARRPDAPATTVTTVERIKRYLDLGGLLLTNADGGNRRFSQEIETLAREMYPRYDWRRLPDDHWAYVLSAPVQRRGTLWGLSNGVRELMIHCPEGDFGAALQTNDFDRRLDLFHTLSNVVFYASERGALRPRLDRKLLFDDEQSLHGYSPVSDASLRRVTVLRGVHRGNWNPEPAADELLSLRLRENRGFDVRFVDVPLAELTERVSPFERAGPSPAPASLLWIRGTDETAFTPEDAAGLRAFLERGGTVLLENVGGLSGFGRHAEDFVSTFTDGRFRRPARHPVITGEGLPTGIDCSQVSYRIFSLERFGGREVRPRLRALHPPDGSSVNGEGTEAEPRTPNPESRLQVFVSREDLTNALLGQPTWGVSGYTTSSAEALIGNLIEYAVQ